MENYFTYHSILFLLGLVIFPRFTLLFSNMPGSLLFWIGWLFLPRLMIAILATLFYSSTNPILVILSWFFALTGESAEKKASYKYSKKVTRSTKEAEFEVIDE